MWKEQWKMAINTHWAGTEYFCQNCMRRVWLNTAKQWAVQDIIQLKIKIDIKNKINRKARKQSINISWNREKYTI